MKTSTKSKINLLWLPVFLCAQVQAQDNIPRTSGFGGFFVGGLGVAKVESNFFAAGAPLLFQKAGVKRVESIYSNPQAKTGNAYPFSGEINYTFSKSKTQLFFGNRLEDLLRLDITFGLGVRQELKDSSIVTFSALVTPPLLQLWADPYVENEDREASPVTMPGLRLQWARMFKTGLELGVTYRWVEINSEKSGQWLVNQGTLDPSLQHLLDRNGNVIRLQAFYRIQLKRGRLRPLIRYINDVQNGAAVSNTGYDVALNYMYPSRKVILDFNVNYGNRKGKAEHPVYNRTLNANITGVAISAFMPVKMGKGRSWSIWASTEYFIENANITFYNSQVFTLMGGLMYRPVKR